MLGQCWQIWVCNIKKSFSDKILFSDFLPKSSKEKCLGKIQYDSKKKTGILEKTHTTALLSSFSKMSEVDRSGFAAVSVAAMLRKGVRLFWSASFFGFALLTNLQTLFHYSIGI